MSDCVHEPLDVPEFLGTDTLTPFTYKHMVMKNEVNGRGFEVKLCKKCHLLYWVDTSEEPTAPVPLTQ